MANPDPSEQQSFSRPEPERAPSDEPLFARDPVAERHARDSSSLAPAQAEQSRRALRSPIIWGLGLLTLAALAGLLFMSMRLHPVEGGRVRGPGDEAAPNAPPDFKTPRAAPRD